jgi:3-oxoacyl-[acyl-carrier protein] reductase
VRALENQVAIVTGAGQGIGREVARALARDGASVVVNDLDELSARTVAGELVEAGERAVAFPGDVTARDFATRIMTFTVNALGAVDVLVNNAGYTWPAPIEATSDEQFQAMLDVHLLSPFRMLRAAFPIFRRQHEHDLRNRLVRQRRVLNVSSITALYGLAGHANYAAAKGGLISLTKSAAKELAPVGVNANCVAFGFVSTRLTASQEEISSHIEIEGRRLPLGIPGAQRQGLAGAIPLGRPAEVTEAAAAIRFLCGPESSYITGEVLTCGGGLVL